MMLIVLGVEPNILLSMLIKLHVLFVVIEDIITHVEDMKLEMKQKLETLHSSP